MHARMIAIAATETRMPNDAPRGAVRSSALISCATNSLLGILGSLPASDSRPSKIAGKDSDIPPLRTMSNVGCEQDVPMAHVRKLQFAVTGYERMLDRRFALSRR
jgi:hypothetical protein